MVRSRDDQGILGEFLFFDWRYHEDGSNRADFELNAPGMEKASILVARRNFGCGSSREHAVWALENYGFRAVLAPSFADIFFSNCFKNGVLPIVLSATQVDKLFNEVAASEGYRLTVDLENQRITSPSGVMSSYLNRMASPTRSPVQASSANSVL